jgi:hypothetical protein
MSICPTGAMDATIGLTPFHIFVKKIAATIALELQRKMHNQHEIVAHVARKLADGDAWYQNFFKLLSISVQI